MRVHGTVKEVVGDRFHLRPFGRPSARCSLRHLLPVAALRQLGRLYRDVRGNRYSVPSELCGSMVAVWISLEGMLSVYACDIKVADHKLRSASEEWMTVYSGCT